MTALISGEGNISALKQPHRPVSFPAYLSKAVLEISRKNSTAYLDNHSVFYTYLSSLLGPVEGHYFFFYLNWGICLAEEGGACVVFFSPFYNSFLRSRSSLVSSLCWTAQYNTLYLQNLRFFSLLSFGHFPADWPVPRNAVPQTKGSRWGYCSSSVISAVQNGDITPCALQALLQLTHPKMTFAWGSLGLFFGNIVNLYSACDLQKNADLSQKSCHLTRLIIVPCCISVPTGCGKGMCHKEDANFLNLR